MVVLHNDVWFNVRIYYGSSSTKMIKVQLHAQYVKPNNFVLTVCTKIIIVILYYWLGKNLKFFYFIKINVWDYKIIKTYDSPEIIKMNNKIFFLKKIYSNIKYEYNNDNIIYKYIVFMSLHTLDSRIYNNVSI